MVRDAPVIESNTEEFVNFIKDSLIIGHNIATYDLHIINSEYYKVTGQYVNVKITDTLYLAKNILSKATVGNHKLLTLIDYYSIETKNMSPCTK